MSPYIIKLSDIEGLNPYLLIGIFTMAGPIGTLLIKETLNKPLKDEIEETLSEGNEEKPNFSSM